MNFINSNFIIISEMSTDLTTFKNNFINKVRQINEINSYYNDYNDLYEECINPFIENFNNYLTKRNEIKKLNVQNKMLKLFADNFNSINESSSNEQEFKNNFRNKFNEDNELFQNYNAFQDYYENLLNIYLVKFRKDLTLRIEKAENAIKNKMLNFFNDNYKAISEISTTEEEFKIKYKNKFDTIPELENQYIQYQNYYETLLRDKCDIFKITLRNRNEKEKIDKESKILQFFNTNYPEISESSSTEEIFLNNIERKKNLDNELLNNLNKYIAYYDTILNENLIKFKNHLKKKIENLLDKKYVDSIHLSSDENEFKNKLKELLEQEEGIRTLLQKEEYKSLYEQFISENIIKIRRDIEIKEENLKNREVNKINKFIDSNYDEIYQISNNKNEFINNMKNKASNMFKNESYFNIYLSRRAKDFEKEKEEEIKKKQKEEKENEYNQILNEIKNEYMQEIINLNFIDENAIIQFQDYNIENSKIFLNTLCTEENYIKQIDDNIDLYINELINEENRKVKHLNILLCGNSGVGKSTLINSILELKEDQIAPTGTGHAITMETKFYNSISVPFLRCADSRGTEIRRRGNQPYGISEVMEEMNKFISEQLDTDNPDNYIHCIWYCILTLDSRFTDVIDECLKELENNYKLNKLPVIIVGTKSISEESDQEFADYLIEKNYNYTFIPVLAKKIDKHEPFGLEELKKKSIQLAMKGIESSCYQGIIKNIIKNSNSKIENQKYLIFASIERKKEEIFYNIELNPNFKTVKMEMENIFIFILHQYANINLSINTGNENNPKELSEKSKNEIDDFIKYFYERCKNICEEKYKIFYDSKVNEFLNKILQKKEEFLESTTIFIETKSKAQMKNEIESNIKGELGKKADIYYLKNILNEFVNLLIKIFPEIFSSLYKTILDSKENKKEIKELIITKITKQFEDLQQEIEQSN